MADPNFKPFPFSFKETKVPNVWGRDLFSKEIQDNPKELRKKSSTMEKEFLGYFLLFPISVYPWVNTLLVKIWSYPFKAQDDVTRLALNLNHNFSGYVTTEYARLTINNERASKDRFSIKSVASLTEDYSRVSVSLEKQGGASLFLIDFVEEVLKAVITDKTLQEKRPDDTKIPYDLFFPDFDHRQTRIHGMIDVICTTFPSLNREMQVVKLFYKLFGEDLKNNDKKFKDGLIQMFAEIDQGFSNNQAEYGQSVLFIDKAYRLGLNKEETPVTNVQVNVNTIEIQEIVQPGKLPAAKTKKEYAQSDEFVFRQLFKEERRILVTLEVLLEAVFTSYYRLRPEYQSSTTKTTTTMTQAAAPSRGSSDQRLLF